MSASVIGRVALRSDLKNPIQRSGMVDRFEVVLERLPRDRDALLQDQGRLAAVSVLPSIAFDV